MAIDRERGRDASDIVPGSRSNPPPVDTLNSDLEALQDRLEHPVQGESPAALLYEKATLTSRLADATDDLMTDLDRKLGRDDTRSAELRVVVNGLREDGIRMMADLYARYPEYGSRDEVMYALGCLEEDKGSMYEETAARQQCFERADKYYEKLIEGHPDSRWVPGALFRLGERAFFEDKDFERAATRYAAAVESSGISYDLTLFARIRTMQCYLELGRYEEATRLLKNISLAGGGTWTDEAVCAAVKEAARYHHTDTD